MYEEDYIYVSSSSHNETWQRDLAYERALAQTTS